MHLGDDIRAADEFPVDKNLGYGRPVGEFLDALAQFFALEDIAVLDGHAVGLQDLHGPGGEPALGLAGRALHIDNDLVVLDVVLDLFA